ncbi:DUF6230 family protein [Antrihabitans sp. YC2-6]|jgi:hypothetical protein|uniref:DUF6230 family protein n=1 Tax=Antrihabitans sp. YC2-6 TaxID=2799498 RepID=UPI0018F32113|nr:DUF6230 family protein [Antrihabitans sp. YC2-6]MBJ8348444.1 hypothetical protein [Antrihabitans sp. YC2-6]
MKLSVPRLASGIGEAVADRARASRERATASVHSWSDHLLEESEGKAKAGTRWGRGSLVLIPTGAAVVAIGTAISQGALAANFNVANQPIDLHINKVTAQGLGIVMASASVKDDQGNSTPKGILHAALGSGEIDGICMIAKQSLMGVTYSVVLSVPEGEQKATGANVQFDVEGLVAHDVALTNALLGKSADEISLNGQSLGGQPGGFGLDATNGTAVLNDVSGSAYGASILGSLEAPVFEASIQAGEVTSC